MTNTRIDHPATPAPIDPEPTAGVIPRQRQRTGFDDEIARLIRERVHADVAKRQARRRRTQRGCDCAQPRPPALLERDPAGGTSVLTICPVCGRRT